MDLKKEVSDMAKNENRNYVTMRCSEWKSELRPVSKNKKNTPERLEIKRYCKKCKKATSVIEKK